jgi:hypothetical protein
MAALALIAGTSIAVGRTLPRSSPTESQGERQPQDAGPSGSQAKSQTSDKKPLDPPIKSVQLNLVIAGLGREGCDVEVMPGNPSCKFRVVNLAGDAGKLNRGKEGAQHVSSAGRAVLELQNVEIRGADRTCAVKIIMHESGQSPKTVYRGFRVPHRDAEATAPSDQTPSFTCYLSSPSKVANAGPSRTRK